MTGRALAHRLRAGLPWLLLATVLAGAALLPLLAPPPPRADDEFLIEPGPGDRLGATLDTEAGPLPGGYLLERGFIKVSHGMFHYRAPGGAHFTVEVHHPRALARPLLATRQFALGQTDGPPLNDQLRSALEHRLRGLDQLAFWVEARPGSGPDLAGRLAGFQVPVAWVLLALLPLGLALAYRHATVVLAGLPRRERWALAAACGLGALLRLLAPHRVVTLFIGYQMTAAAAGLDPIPRYGAGGTTLFHALFQVLPLDHATLLLVDALLGAATLPIFAALAQRLTGRPRATLLATALAALLPVFVAHDASDSNLAPALLWGLGGLLLLLEGLRARDHLALTAALPLLALAGVSRPELPLLLPCLALLSGLVLRRELARPLPWGSLAALGLAFGLLMVPHAAHVLSQASLLAGRDSLPLAGPGPLFNPGVAPALALLPAAWPVALAPMTLLPLVLGDASVRWRGAALLLASLAASAAYWVDLCAANMLRVLVPGGLFATLAAALGLDLLLERLSLRLAPTWARRLALGAVALAVLTSALPTAAYVWRPTNQDQEEALQREALNRLPDHDSVLVRLGYGDVHTGLAGSPTHLYFPDYLYDDPARNLEVQSINDWTHQDDHPVGYFLLNLRCWTPEHPWPLTGPRPRRLRQPCADLLRDGVAEPVFERELPNLGDPFLTGYYDHDPRPFRVGLYRLKPPR